MRFTRQIPEASGGADPREVHFVKGGHRYTFRYDDGGELGLVCALLGAAIDPRLNIDLEDVKKLMSTLGFAPANPS